MRNRFPHLWAVAGGLVLALASHAPAATLPPGFVEGLFASGLDSPTAMQFAPDGRLFVCEKAGRLRVIKDGALLAAPFVTVTVNDEAERGLLGVAFDPNFTVTPYVYVYYTVPAGGGRGVHNRVSRFTAVGDVAAPGSETVVVDLNDVTTTIHNAGAIEFGDDGMLYIAVGDDSVGTNAPSLSTRLGKLLRLHPNGAIPTDNPFYLSVAGPNRAIWAYGLRNPFKFAINRGGPPPRILINDVGGSQFEEVNEGVAGANYGYPAIEGYSTHPDYTSPRHAYDHGPDGGCAITGGAFYTPGSGTFPAGYANTYFFADLCAGFIRRLDPAAGNVVTPFATGIAAPVDLRVFDGDLYYLSIENGAVYRVEYGAAPPRIVAHPQAVMVSPGEAATFTVAASGGGLAYQWQRDGVAIPNATGPRYTLASPQLGDSGARFRVVVSNSLGTTLTNEALLTVTTNQPPVAGIPLPDAALRYAAGQTITFTGAAVDPEDGTLPAAAYTWRVDFHHATHFHPFLPATSGLTQGSFVVPAAGETAPDVWYRIHLTVRDSGGRTATVFRDILPRLATVTLATSPPGLQVRLDGRTVTTPFVFQGVVGVSRAIEAAAQQSGGVGYAFDAWSDYGAAARVIATPDGVVTLTARFVTVSAAGPPAAPARLELTANGRTLRVAWDRALGAQAYRLEAGTAPGLSDLADLPLGDIEHVEAVVPPGTYFVRVRAVNGHGLSGPSNESALTVADTGVCTAPPPPPANFTAQAGGLLAALAWNASPAATSYLLEAGSGSGLANLLVQDTAGATSLQAIAPAGVYVTRVRAVNACGVSAPSAEATLTLGCSAGAVVPLGLEVVKAGGVAQFRWLPPLGATGYRLLLGTSPGVADLGQLDVGPATTLAVSLAGVPPGTYYVRVAAASACGIGSPSNEVAVAVP